MPVLKLPFILSKVNECRITTWIICFNFILPFYGDAQYLDSLPDGFIAAKWINKTPAIRIVPLNTKTWRNLTSYTVTSKIGNESKDKPLALTAADAWPEISDSFSIMATSFKLNFDSDKKAIEALPTDENGNLLSYTHDEIEDIRYFFNYLACNQDYSVAQLNGLGFFDNQKESIQDIVYSIPSIFNITPLIIKNGKRYEGVKPPIPLHSIADQQILFEWPALPYFYQYYGFQLERSFDGKKYTQLNNGPIINYHSGEKKVGFRSYFSYQDTLHYGKTIYYRLKGLDYFGGQSDPGDPVIIRIPKIIPAPLLTGYNLGIHHLQLNWDFDSRYERDITGFSIWCSDSVNGTDKKRIKANVDKKTRTLVLSDKNEATKFYFIEINRPDASGTFSFPIMIVKSDASPPASPSQFLATMNDKGIVALSWAANKENDILGYRLFRSVDSLSEFAVLTDTIIANNAFWDTLSLNTLTTRIFYRAAAIDQNYNLSKLSEIISIQVFDTIRPSQPVFYQYTPLISGVLLKWYPSFSIDVRHTLLQKRLFGSTSEWEIIKTTPALYTSDSILDQNVNPGMLYEYSLTAVDHAGNQSVPSRPLVAKPLISPFLPVIEIFKGEYNKEKKLVQLQWEYAEPGILEYWIYKNKQDEAPSLFKQLSAAVNIYEDKDVLSNKVYTYYIRAIHEDGRESTLSKAIVVKNNE